MCVWRGRYGDVRDMFSALTTAQMRPILLDLVETAWGEVAESSTRLNIQVQEQNRLSSPKL